MVHSLELSSVSRSSYSFTFNRQYFVVLPSLSHFCSLWLVLILKLNDVRKQIPAAFKWLYKYSLQVQQYLSKIRVSQTSSSSCIIRKHQYKWYGLYNTSNCSFCVRFPTLFSLEVAVLIFALTSSTSMSLKWLGDTILGNFNIDQAVIETIEELKQNAGKLRRD